MEDRGAKLPDEYLTRKIQRVWPDAICWKQWNGTEENSRFWITRSSGEEIALSDPDPEHVPENRFVEASRGVNAIVRAARAEIYKGKGTLPEGAEPKLSK